LQEGFYQPLGQKSLDAVTRIRSNGKHLLGLINTVLDIAKNKKLTQQTEVAKSLPIGLGDEQRLTQVLLNLVGNAITFTDAGELRIAATGNNGHFVVSVTDTGPGIPKER
jgi:C4-dicarboxylate-specific signal transduction histidine kinase